MQLLPSHFLLLISVLLILSFRLPLFLFSSGHWPPSCQQGTHRQSTNRQVPSVFSCYFLLLKQSLSFTSCPLFFHWFGVFCVRCFLLLADVFHWQLAVAAEVAPLSLPHLQHEYLEICKSTMTAPQPSR